MTRYPDSYPFVPGSAGCLSYGASADTAGAGIASPGRHAEAGQSHPVFSQKPDPTSLLPDPEPGT